MVSETGTIPPPREPLSTRESDLLRRLIGDADAIDEAMRTGSSERLVRVLMQLGYWPGTAGDAVHIIKTLRRVAGLIVSGGPMQGTA